MTKKDSVNPEQTDEMEASEEIREAEANSKLDEQAGAEASEGDVPSHDQLQLMLEDARSKADEHWDQLLRANAELENTRRRARQDVENAHKFALEKFAIELLPVKDSLEMGLAAAGSDSEGSKDNEKAAQLLEGTQLTLKMLASAMEKFGITEVNPVGEAFNPETHQAMSMQESSEHQPNTVMLVMQKGYLLNERLLRPAMVVVAKTATEKETGEK